MASQDTLSDVSQQDIANKLQSQRDKYKSPPPPPESMTPPPSSQAPTLASAAQLVSKARTPTPTPTQLSSPPRTGSRQRSADYGIFSAQQVEAASSTDKDNMLATLARELRAARASAAHYRLQCEWAQIECDKAVETMGVELDMANREIRVLQHQARTPQVMADEQQMAHWRHTCAIQESDISILRDALERQSVDLRNEIADRDERLATALTEVVQLRERIKENRSHMNLWRDRPSSEHHSTPLPQTPARQIAARDPYVTPISKPRGTEGLNALLMATEPERHGVASTPSTPLPRDSRKAQFGHRRASQSLSSIQLSPSAPRTAPQPSRSQQAYDVHRNWSSPQHQPAASGHRRRRRSRDSTISADGSDDEHHHGPAQDYEVYESQASQAATEILRRSASSSFNRDDHSAKRGAAVGPTSAKLYGAITKGALGKHKFKDDGGAEMHAAKKMRANEGIGLGIGGWAPGAAR